MSATRAPKLPAMSELDFRRQLVGPKGLATMLGWVHVGFRPAQTAHGWRTPVTGELGKGWPDLVLIRVRDRRLIFAELKRDGHDPDPDQRAVLEVLRSLELPDSAEIVRIATTHPAGPWLPRVQVCVWHPSDLTAIAEVLR